MDYKSIFKRYDIRGKYPGELNEAVAIKLAQAYFHTIRPREVVIGYYNIYGSDIIARAFSAELITEGVKVYNVGSVTTPMLYFSSSYKNIPLSIMCTASHLGEGYTGIKPNKDGIPLEEEAVLAIKVEFDRLTTIASHDFELVPAERQPETINIYGPYVATIASLLSYPLYNYKVAVDLGNGNNAFVAEQLLHKVGIDYRAINSEVRDRDLQHPSNPKMQSNRSQLEHLIAEMGADLGVIWDGDCDRCYLVDWAGEVIPPEYVAIKIAGLLKKTNSYSHITADVRASFAVERELAKEEIKVKRIQAWHVPIKYEMEQDPTIGFGFEVSGHYVFKDFFKIDDGLLAFLLFIEALENLKLDFKADLSKFHSTYYIPEEMNFTSPISEEELKAKLPVKYKDGLINLVDGVSIDYPTWRFNIRASRTEPILRLNISGTNRAEVGAHLADIERVVGGKKLAS